MILKGLTILLVALVGNAGQTLDHPVTVSLFAVQATKENRAEGGKFLDKGLEPVRSVLQDLDFDTFKKVKVDKIRAKVKEESRLSINSQYTLSITPLSGDSEGRVRVKVWIEEAREVGGAKKVVKALDTTTALAPGKYLVLGGLPLKEGKLVILLTLEK